MNPNYNWMFTLAMLDNRITSPAIATRIAEESVSVIGKITGTRKFHKLSERLYEPTKLEEFLAK